ncbi:MAG: phosphatidate cytidylyltransferase [Myxococcaceae bacterium]|nr:phosphatidate cytidylyltransferase [Myxococcaceae bacterium]
MNDKNRNLLVRIATAVLLLPGVIFLLWRGGWWTAALVAAAAAVCASEYLLIVWKRLGAIAWGCIAAAGLLPLLPALAPRDAFALGFFVVGGTLIVTWTWHLLRGPLAEAPERSAHGLTAVVYGSLGPMCIAALRLIPEQGLGWVIAALTITWVNDTTAYFAGRFLGRHKLYVEVSPNKTWEGFFGGMVGSIGGMFVLRAFFFRWLTVTDCVCLGLAGGVFGPIGDLTESMLKRAYKVKDSGKIIPGHGGLLDRIDALVFNAPMVFVWVAFLRAHVSGG